MIGVLADPHERAIVQEFFELFKTPWEFYRDFDKYDIILCSGKPPASGNAALVIIYSESHFPSDGERSISSDSLRHRGATLMHAGVRLSIAGTCLTFPGSPFNFLIDEATGEPAIQAWKVRNSINIKIGYSLFDETRYLLKTGQPAADAISPTLERHVALLRDLILRSGIPLVEIPPFPAGHSFIACLTHDIDHPRLRNHLFDHTMCGFLYRSSLGCLIDVIRGRKSAYQLLRNLKAVALLPLVHLGLVQDIWGTFDRYLKIESGMGGTYFAIPKKGTPGQKADGTSEKFRASSYELEEISSQLKRIVASGNEVGVHGIDAWRDIDAARRELIGISNISKSSDIGIRMHWLYFDESSAGVLDKAGFSFDSTFGYNRTVGFRAGTAQAFKPEISTNLLELPLIAMDTALFLPGYLNLSEADAFRLLCSLIDMISLYGGVFTVNWHDRSILPERLWDVFYLKLLAELKRRGAWCPTASDAVAWFRKRRSAKIEEVSVDDGVIKVRSSSAPIDSLPELRIRIHRRLSGSSHDFLPAGDVSEFVDVPYNNFVSLSLR